MNETQEAQRAASLAAFLSETRNGANTFSRHGPLMPRLVVSNGVDELVDLAGCAWLLDILGTELVAKLLPAINAGQADVVQIFLDVQDRKGHVVALQGFGDDAPVFWRRDLPYADFPDGKWHLFQVATGEVNDDGTAALSISAILPSEH